MKIEFIAYMGYQDFQVIKTMSQSTYILLLPLLFPRQYSTTEAQC